MQAERRRVSRALVVEDDACLQEELVLRLRRRDWSVRGCSTVAEVEELLPEDLGEVKSSRPCEEHEIWFPDLVLLDVALPDGNAFDVLARLDLLQSLPSPWVVISTSTATAEQGFDLRDAGAIAFLSKPFVGDQLDETINRVLETPPNVKRALRTLVGFVPLQCFEEDARVEIVREALRISQGNIAEAARLLGIHRQLLQYIRKRYGLE